MERGSWPDVPLIAIDVPSEFDPNLSPVPGHQIANCQVFCSPDPESGMGEEAMRHAEKVLDELWPDLPVWYDKLPVDGGSVGWADAVDRNTWYAAIGIPLNGVSIMAFERDTFSSIDNAVS